MGEQLTDTIDVHKRLFIGIVGGTLNVLATDFFANEPSELIVDFMPGSSGDDTTFYGFTNQCYIP